MPFDTNDFVKAVCAVNEEFATTYMDRPARISLLAKIKKMLKKDVELKIGDVVFLRKEILDVNWRMEEFIDLPFLVINSGKYPDTNVISPFGDQSFGREFSVHKHYLETRGE